MSEADKLKGRGGSASQPMFPGNAALVDISATDATFDTPSAVRAGGAGDLKVDTAAGDTVVLPSLVAGEYAGCLVTKVYKVGTTATLLSRYWL